MNGSRWARSGVAAALVCCFGIGCQLLLTDAGATQCSTSADCAAKGFPFAVCGPSQTCINPTDFCATAADCPAAQDSTAECVANKCKYTPVNFCATDADCSKLFDGEAAKCTNNRCEAYPPLHCFKNSECSAKLGGEPAVCVEETCKKLKSEDCAWIAGTPEEYNRDDVLVFGYMGNISGSGTTSQGLGTLGGAILARQHFLNTFGGGLPGATAGDKPRPFVYVVCNEFINPERAARHLVEDLKLPFILGPDASSNTYIVARNVTAPAGVAILTPSSTTGALGTLNNGLTFRNFGTDDDFLTFYKQIATQKETFLRGNGTIPVGGTMKVAILHRGDTPGTYNAQNITANVTWNGKNGADNLAAGDLKLFNYGYAVGQSQAESDAATTKAVTDAIAYRPHMIFVSGTGEMFTILQNIESGWGAFGYSPIYVPYSAAAGFAWKDWAIANPTVRSRVIFASHQVPPPGDTTATAVEAQAKIEFDTLFPGGFSLGWFDRQNVDAGVPSDAGVDGGAVTQVGGLTNSGGARAGFDDGHIGPLAYIGASALAQGKPVTGALFAQSLKTLFKTTGTRFAITANAAQPLSDAVSNLQRGAAIGWYGITGLFELDAKGSTRAQVGLRCIGAAPNYTTAAAGPFFNGVTDTTTGTCGVTGANPNACAAANSGPCW